MKKTTLRNYAKLIAVMGVNVQKGQDVFIDADPDQPDFVMTLAEECYKAGARNVFVDMDYLPMEKIHLKYCSLDELSKVRPWEIAKLKYKKENLPCAIYLASHDPDGLKGADQAKLSESRRRRYPVFKPYEDATENKFQWCVAAVPGEKWAKKLFPGLRKQAAVEKLWEAILTSSRAIGDPIENWKEHNASIAARCEKLNSLNIRYLEYKSPNGTDLKVGFSDKALFCGGSEPTLSGTYFNANIPSEEIYTTPDKFATEGIVYSTMPLSYRGQLIEDFFVRFEKGRAVEWDAKKNASLLGEMIKMDKGSCYLGECALVPFDSPIRQSGILFFNTLFDENASCHLALGDGYTNCIKGFETMKKADLKKIGVNESMTHVDFMIGSADLNIDAVTRDGKRVPIFRKGGWAF